MSSDRFGQKTDEGSSPQVPAAFLTSTGFLLARVGSESRKRFSHALARWKLRPAHYGVLMALAERGTASQLLLGKIVGIDPRNMVALIDHLEERSLVVRGVHPTDRRHHAVRLTRDGERMLRELRAVGEQLEREMFAALTDPEQATLHALLLKLLPTVTDTTDSA